MDHHITVYECKEWKNCLLALRRKKGGQGSFTPQLSNVRVQSQYFATIQDGSGKVV